MLHQSTPVHGHHTHITTGPPRTADWAPQAREDAHDTGYKGRGQCSQEAQETPRKPSHFQALCV